MLSRVLNFYHRKIFDLKMWFRWNLLKISDDDYILYREEIGRATTDIILYNFPIAGSTVARISKMQDNVRQHQRDIVIEEFFSALAQEDKSKINWTRYKSQDFILLFNSVTIRAQQTTAKEKRRRFREILIKELHETYESDFKETFLDLILRLNEDQITILNSYKKTFDVYGPFVRGEKGESEDQKVLRERINHCPKATDFGYAQDLYFFYVQDLISKSLMYDEGMGRLGASPFKIVYITKFGLEFLDFITTAEIIEK